MKFVIATGNAHKVEEFSRMLKFLDFSAVSAKELGIDMDKAVENGDTFEQNALIKAKYACEKSGLAAFADDSGLCVDALDGRPGIYSARYAKTDALRIEKLLCELEGVEKEKRGAKFVSAIACVFPDGTSFTVRGETEGQIDFSPKGSGGFGYDPILMLPEYGKTSAEITMDEKNAISHRGKALRAMKKRLAEEIGE